MKILGIEFGTWSVKAVELESRFRRLDILDFYEVRLPLQSPDPTASYREATKQLLGRVSGGAEKLVTSLPASQTALRFLQIPVKQRKKVEQMYRFELEDNVPFKLDESIIEHHVTRYKDGSLVFAAIGLTKHITSHLEWLNSIGIDPDWLTFDGMGIVNLYLTGIDPKAVAPEQGPVLLLDLGHQKTNISIFDQERLQLFRTVSWGGAQITQSIAMALSVSLEEAEQCKMNDLKLDVELEEAQADKKEIALAASQAFTSFLADINHSLVSFRTLYGQQITKVLLTGGTSKTWGIENFLQRSLDVPVEHFKSFKTFTLKKDQQDTDEARFGEALGRAYSSARKATLLFNFRKGTMGKETSLTEVSELLKNPAILTLFKYAAIFAGILFLHVNVAAYVADQEAKASTKDLQSAIAATFPEVPTKMRTTLAKSPKDLQKYINKKIEDIDRKIKLASRTKKPMLSLVLSVTNAFPLDVRVDVNKLTLDDKSLVLEGVLYDGDINKVTEALKKVPSIAKVDLERDGQRFTYRGELTGR